MYGTTGNDSVLFANQVQGSLALGRAPYQVPSLTATPLLAGNNTEIETGRDWTNEMIDSLSRTPGKETRFPVPPPPVPDTVSSIVMQKWEGLVLEVGAEVFTARLVTITGSEGDLIAEIYYDDIDREDRSLLKPGATFYWSIGYLDRPSGREKFSQIRMRRLPVWSAGEIAAAEKKAQELGALLDGALVQ